RVGADEFAVLLRGVGDGAAALKVAEGLLARFAQPFAAGEREFGAGASIGVAAAIKGDAGACVNAYADIALNQAKKSGSHRVILHAPETRTHAAARLDLEAAMRAAISNGELELNYQPIVRLSDGGLSGWEALARWRRAGGDVVSPAEFIPIAEETGFITELGVWALTQAAEDASNFGAMGAPADAFISVNLSPRQLLHSEALEGALASAIRLYPNIKLEVTETAIVDNPERALVTLQRLRATGARLALDDFGTGASSLAMLNRYPFSTLKIDRAFVEDQGAHAANVLRCIVGLARALGLETVAEGVEDEEGRAMLALIGATYGQGYFFGRPEPADKVIKRLTSATPVASSLALSAG
ncbi:MAG: GGDEF domain-containing phosphodiesterase, partial [Pseudomonadota bacterium]